MGRRIGTVTTAGTRRASFSVGMARRGAVHDDSGDRRVVDTPSRLRPLPTPWRESGTDDRRSRGRTLVVGHCSGTDGSRPRHDGVGGSPAYPRRLTPRPARRYSVDRRAGTLPARGMGGRTFAFGPRRLEGRMRNNPVRNAGCELHRAPGDQRSTEVVTN